MNTTQTRSNDRISGYCCGRITAGRADPCVVVACKRPAVVRAFALSCIHPFHPIASQQALVVGYQDPPNPFAQSVGMAKELTEELPKAKEMFEQASEILGYDLLKVTAPVGLLHQPQYAPLKYMGGSCVRSSSDAPASPRVPIRHADSLCWQ